MLPLLCNHVAEIDPGFMLAIAETVVRQLQSCGNIANRVMTAGETVAGVQPVQEGDGPLLFSQQQQQ